MPSPRLKWLEITADYRCNNRCVGCFSLSGVDASMSAAELRKNLELGRARGSDSLWIGGGEPTLRKDLLPLVLTAKRLGYQTIKLQTNGMLLAYPKFSAQLFHAGVNQVNFSIKGASAATHDRLTDTAGCYDLMLQGIAHSREHGVHLEGDLLVYTSNMAELPAMVSSFSALGLQRFSIWLFSAAGQADPALLQQVPRIADVMPHITAAMDLGLSDRADFITSLHTPPCTVPASHAACRFHSAQLGLLVTNPGGYNFMLETSPIEGGVFFERCAQCSTRDACNGVRADYVTQYGDAEFNPI